MPKNLELEKQLSVGTESTDEDFNFNVYFTKADGTPLNSLSWFKSLTDIESPNWVEQSDIELQDGKGVLSIKAGEKVLIYNLPEGATYTITEAKNTNYGVEEIVITGSGTINKDEASGKVTGTIVVDENVSVIDQKTPSNTIKYVNAKIETSGLTVTKEVGGTHGDKDREFHFTITLDDKTISGKFGDMDFTDGVAAITLKHGQRSTATGLPAGIGYTVEETEANQDGYVTTSKGDKGTVPANGDVDIKFINYKEVTSEKPSTPDKPDASDTPKTPKTDDKTNIELYLSLFAMSGLLIAILAVLKKKKILKNR